MQTKKTVWAEVDEAGRLVLPAEIAGRFGLVPGARLRIDEEQNNLRLHRPATHLAKVYLEPTNRCNLTCRTCIRNSWEVDLGRMSDHTFQRVLDELATIDPRPTVFFGGIGEPLFHPKTIEMVRQVKTSGSRVELITNGTLLDVAQASGLIEAGLDMLWVSLDGARPESYADVRLGAELPQVLKNLARFRDLRPPSHRPRPEIGLAFVAMKRNIADLPELLALGKRLRISQMMVTNLLAPSLEMYDEILYKRSLRDTTYIDSPWVRKLFLPKMDLDEITEAAWIAALRSGYNITLAGNNLGGANDVCNFIESGSLTIGWDGGVSPCPPLLYTHTSALHDYERVSHRHIIGNIQERDLLGIWHDPEYIAYRERVQRFAFAPSTFCGGCDLSRSNQSDCFGNPAPACGACLWAQGLVQCP
jgi:MoaA/NifB/PqqE/SkfB family radical SAM enzyme